MTTTKTPLKKFVYHVLAIRVALMAVFIAAALGLVALFTAQNNVGRATVERALRQVALFNLQSNHILDTKGLSDPEELQRKLAAFAVGVNKWSVGRFVLVDLLDLTGNPVVSLSDPAFDKLDVARKHLTDETRQLPTLGGSTHHALQMDGGHYALITAPLLTSEDKQLGYINGVFAMSETTVAGIRREILTTVLLVVLIVLVTVAILYPVILGLTRKLARYSESLLEANLETLNVLGGAVAKRDSDTSAHNQRVTIMAARLAEAVGMDSQEIQGLIKGALVHDVGKIAIHDAILLKPGKLTDEEYEVMQTHVQHGQDIVKCSAWLEDAAKVVRFHHEKYDGSGYMEGLKGNAIPTTARIFALVDVFDALTSRRPYKEALTLEETTSILEEGRGTHFDPELLTAFLKMAPELYDTVAGREEDDLQDAIRELTSAYIAGGLETLHY